MFTWDAGLHIGLLNSFTLLSLGLLSVCSKSSQGLLCPSPSRSWTIFFKDWRQGGSLNAQQVHLSHGNGQRVLVQMYCPHSDQNETSTFVIVQFEREKELKMGSLSKNALGLLLHFHVKGSTAIWTRLSREKTNLSKHHNLCSCVGSGVPWSWRVTWAHWALGEFSGFRSLTLVWCFGNK